MRDSRKSQMLWNNYRYRVEDDSIVIEDYCGEELDVSIPAEIEGLPVKKIAPEAFSIHGAMIERIEVPGSVTDIGDGAFKMCMSLEELVLQEGVCRIGENVLLVTAVTQLYLPTTVEKLKCPWEWGKVAIDVAQENQHYFSDGYGLYEKREDGDALVAVWAEDQRVRYTVASNTTVIEQHAFEGQMYIQEVELPEGVISIEKEAFESCQALRRIVLPEGLIRICADAFRCCISLEGLELPSTLKDLGEHAVTDTYGWSPSMNGITYMRVHPDNPYFYHDANAFYQRRENGSLLIKYFGKNEVWKIPEEVTELGAMALRRSNLREIIIPETVKSISKDAFAECGRLECMEFAADGVKLYVPENPVYRKGEISSLFYRDNVGQLHYDYETYDSLLADWSQILIRCRMAAFRLEYPGQLPTARKQAYEALIAEHLKDLVYDICKRDSLMDLAALGNAGMITAEHIEEMIDWTTACRRGKLTGYLLEYQQEHFTENTFDFSL